MTTFLLDTSVLSETSKPRPHPAIVRFLEDAEDVAICAAVVMELHLGITRLCKTDPLRAVKLGAWWAGQDSRIAAAALYLRSPAVTWRIFC